MHEAGEPRPLLEELGSRYGLSPQQLDQLTQILELLALDDFAPTSVREPSMAVDVHIADSLVALELELVREARQVADVGAGAGFPGLPLAVALPSAEVGLVESQARKCMFIERLEAQAGIANVEVVCARVEEWPEGLGVHDLVLARAVAPQPVVLEYAAPLLRLGGALVDWRGQRDLAEESAGAHAAELLGLHRESVKRVQPYEGVRDHNLHVYRKERETPDRFPRRSGMARKKPLAG
jgi:16S rRNA (guanine527-N7)-methyltransferase